MLKFCIKINNADTYELFTIPENEKVRIYDECDFDTFCKRYNKLKPYVKIIKNLFGKPIKIQIGKIKPYTKKEIKKIELYIEEGE